MTRKEVLLLLTHVEETIPVWEWKYGDMNIWPLIKKEIFFMFFNNKENLISPIGPIKSRVLTKLGNLSSSFFYLLRVKFRKTEKITTLYCGAAAHRVDFESNFINRYFFPITEHLKETKYIHYEYGSIIKDKKYKNKESIIYVNKLHPIFKLFRRFKKQPKLSLFKWNEFQSCILERSGLDLSNYYKILPVKLDSLMAYADISSLLLKKYRPDKIIGLCYYNNAMFAMHYIANKMNFENFDVQHGGQGSLHSMYTFASFPIGGSNVLPKTFWCWDQVSANHILSWLGSQNYHRIEVNGNPWIEFQLEKYSNQEILSKKKIILYTLQEKELEEYILRTIKLTPENFSWWIRLHPRMLDAKANIERQLEFIGCKNKVEIVKATHYPLPVLLKESFVHISKFSGSIIEAVLVNTPNIIIDEVGVEMYEDYIVSGNAHKVLTKNAEDLLNRILTIE